MILDRLLADSEDERDADGFLSWEGETHAFLTVGFPVGFLTVLSGFLWLLGGVVLWALRTGESPLSLPYREQLLEEAGYLVSGLTLGAIAGLIARQWIHVPDLPSLIPV